MLVNGRSPGDSPARYTYVGPRGRSTIDFAFTDVTNLHLVHDFFVDQLILPSDHFPITLDLLVPPSCSPPICDQECFPRPLRLVWKRERIDNYLRNISENTLLTFDPTADLNTSMATLYQCITEAADIAGMRSKPFNSNSFRAVKPWYDRECRDAKRRTSQLLQTCQSSAFQPLPTSAFRTSRKSYFDLISEKKTEYFNNLRESIAKTRSPGEF